jgi:hypothetical protein
MTSLLRLLTQYELLFYLVLSIILVVFASRVWRAWREWSTSLFGLEKEHTQQQINQGISVLIFTIALGIGLFVLTTFVAPSVPGVQMVSTPTADLTAQPTLTISTPTVSLTTTGLIPTLSAILDMGCVPDKVQWTDPINGDSISGKYVLKGTVNVQNLGYYKFEYAPSDSENWTTIAAGNRTITNEPLGGSWDTGSLTPGEYKLRLVVTNNQNEPMPECMINVTIKASD